MNKMNLLFACALFAVVFCGMNCVETPKSDSEHGIQIASANDTSFTLHEDNLKKLKTMLEEDDIKDRELVVVSIAGRDNVGMSFLMNLFIRYLESESNRSDWVRKDQPISGFVWGVKRTGGISVWNKIFKRTQPNGKKVAIILIDTQGLNSMKNDSFNEDARIYAFSALSSSVQLYNVLHDLNSLDLDALDLFSGYCGLTNENECKQFQNLDIIVRDKLCTENCQHGRQSDYVKKSDSIIYSNDTNAKEEELKRFNKYYEHIDLFYLPSPDDNVIQRAYYDGNLADVKPPYIEKVKDLAEHLFTSENLVVKKFDNQPIKARDFSYYLKTYADILKSIHLPEPSTYFQLILNIKYESWKKDKLELYKKLMENKVKPCTSENEISYLSREELLYTHDLFKNESIKEFPNQKKLNSEKIVEKYMAEFKDDIDKEFYKNYWERNKGNKDCFKSKSESFYRFLVENITETYKHKISNEVKDAPNLIEDRDFRKLSHQYITNATNEFDAQDKYKTNSEYPKETTKLFKSELENELKHILMEAKNENELKFQAKPFRSNSSIVIRSNVAVISVFIVIAIFRSTRCLTYL